MGDIETVNLSTMTTKNGMSVTKKYERINNTHKVLRECIFPENHYMQKMYGIEKMVTAREGKAITSIDVWGKILGRNFFRPGAFTKELPQFLKSLASVKNLQVTKLVEDLIRVGQHIR